MPVQEGKRSNFKQSQNCRNNSTSNHGNRARQGQGQSKSQYQGQGRGKGQLCTGKSWGGQQRDNGNRDR